MKDDELEPLPDILARAFEAERERVDDDPVLKETVLRKVERAVLLAGSAPGPDRPSPETPQGHHPPAGAGHVLTTKALGLVVAASFAAGAVTAGGVLGVSRSPTAIADAADAASTVAAPAPAPADAAPAIAVAPADAAVVTVTELPSARELDAGHAPPSSTVGSGADLTRERELIDVARAALARGRPDVALDAVERHGRLFPTGKLSEERDAVRVQALVAARRRTDAEQAARRFHRAYPASLMSEIVDTAVSPPRVAP